MRSALRDLLELNKRNPDLEGEQLIDLFFEKTDYIDISTWSKIDIIDTAEDMGYELTPEEVNDVAGYMARKHDANIGINWEVIQVYIDMVIKDREKK